MNSYDPAKRTGKSTAQLLTPKEGRLELTLIELAVFGPGKFWENGVARSRDNCPIEVGWAISRCSKLDANRRTNLKVVVTEISRHRSVVKIDHSQIQRQVVA